jgi:peptidoglycan hydrolase-like protein with peptidoglycan-binding domain
MTRLSDLARPALLIVAAAFAAMAPALAGQPSVGATNPGDSLPVTPALIRQVQFMLLSLGIDPGPIDGVPRHLTNAAIRKFEQQSDLPAADLVTGGRISTELLDRLRKAASGVLLGTQPQGPAAAVVAPPPAPPPAIATAPAPRPAAAPRQPPSPADHFAACPFNRVDFLIGGMQYTPDSFLATGFGGSTATAVDSLKDRLQEARLVAQQIGGQQAPKEVERQVRVLSYFECRLRIEQADAGKK